MYESNDALFIFAANKIDIYYYCCILIVARVLDSRRNPFKYANSGIYMYSRKLLNDRLKAEVD